MTVPIKNVEYLLSDIDLQVTKTDLNGVITYANSDFEQASGYPYNEIIGKSHSIIHHPDMPSEVFADLWQTLKEGRTWIGVVKNLRKDGGYFWTLINVTPDYEHGKHIGYLASRRKASRQEIDFFEPAYKILKQGTDKNLKIKNSFLYRHNWRNRLLFYKRFTIKQRIIVMISLFAGIMFSISGIGLSEMNELMQMQVDMFPEDYNETHLKFEHAVKKILILCITGFSLSVLLGVRLYKLIALPLREVSHSMRHCDHRDVRVKGGTVTEITEILDAFKTHQIRDRFFAAEAKRTADNNLRVKIGLDSVSTGVMVADQNRNIIYYNKAVENLLRRAESDIRKELPNFNVSNLMGSNIDGFHKNPEHQKKILDELKQRIAAKINIGGRSLVVIANPVIDERGQHLGSTAEWHDRTDEVIIETQVSEVVESIAHGDFSKRIDETSKEDFVLRVSQGINQLVEACSNSLNETASVLNSLSQGDLTKTIDGHYSGTFEILKDDVNKTVNSLKNIVEQIQEATNQISNSAQAIAVGNNDLSNRTEKQAISLDLTSRSMEKLTHTVKDNAENAKEANQLVVDASSTAERGVDVVNQVVQTMEDINESSRKIGDIISVIDDIAFQTNILALNAAVEAARAGEQGKGFAVVAVEVRNLAQRAATAAGEIKTLIGDSVVKVNEGSKLVTTAGQTMEEIVNSIHGVTTIMSQISSASIEQSQGIEQVNEAVKQMDEVIQQNAALVEESASAAQTLEMQAKNLVNTVHYFNS
ncbi:MAG: methyl-accepting chemotaxis protein [Methylococcales bacterium]|nr:methyl-accepting chemotaxis protein [Methylococcales bacterium]MDD5755196.1 methyl-accepting chemotaxis protein [Methylococcales bacterium]